MTDRVSDPLSYLLGMTRRYILQKHPHVRSPFTVMEVTPDTADKGKVKARHMGDTYQTGASYPWIIPYSATAGPTNKDRVVVMNGPAGPFIVGKLSG